MENIDNIGKNSLEALSKNNLTESGKKRLGREIFCAAIALACLAVGLIYGRIFRIKKPFRHCFILSVFL